MEIEKIEKEIASIHKLIQKFRETRDAYKHYLEYVDTASKEGLCSYYSDFNVILSETLLREAFFWRLRTLHDDKRCTSEKARITHQIHLEEKSFAKSESMAAASKEYLEFLDKRATYYEAYNNITNLSATIQAYMKELDHRLYAAGNSRPKDDLAI